MSEDLFASRPGPAAAHLERWSQRIPIWLLSNHRSGWLLPRLERFGLKALFQRVIISDMIGAAKPSPAAFQPIVEQPATFVGLVRGRPQAKCAGSCASRDSNHSRACGRELGLARRCRPRSAPSPLDFSGNRWTMQIDALVLPFRETFAAIFFVSLGLFFDPRVLINEPLIMLGCFTGLVLLKAAASTVALRLTGLNWQTAVGMGIGLAHIGDELRRLLRPSRWRPASCRWASS